MSPIVVFQKDARTRFVSRVAEEDVPAAALVTMDAFLTWASSSDPAREQIVIMLGVNPVKRSSTHYWSMGAKGVWTMYRSPRGHIVHLARLDPRASTQLRRYPILATLDPAKIGTDLARWYGTFGVQYRGTPGIAGLAILRHSLERRRLSERVEWRAAPPIIAAEPEISAWSSDRWMQDKTSVHRATFDRVRAYLAAANSVTVAACQLEHTGGIVFAPARAGWWRIRISPDAVINPRLPHPAPQLQEPGAEGWVTTPTAKFLTELGVVFDVRESWTAAGIRLFRPWAEALEHAYQLFGPDGSRSPGLTATVKQAYRETIGLLNRETGSVYRPDWHYAIIAQARTSVLRHVWRAEQITGIGPSEVATDALTYHTEHADPADAALKLGIPIGNRLGRYRVKE